MYDDGTRPMYGMARRHPQINPGPLWTGGVATALVAALIALVGVVVARGIFLIPVLGPSKYGTFGDVSTVWLCATAALGALVATGLMHLLLLTTPRPNAFFGWIVALITVVFALEPFTIEAPLDTQIATGLINLIIGLAIGTLISGVAAAAIRRS